MTSQSMLPESSISNTIFDSALNARKSGVDPNCREAAEVRLAYPNHPIVQAIYARRVRLFLRDIRCSPATLLCDISGVWRPVLVALGVDALDYDTCSWITVVVGDLWICCSWPIIWSTIIQGSPFCPRSMG